MLYSDTIAYECKEFSSKQINTSILSLSVIYEGTAIFVLKKNDGLF